MQLIHITLNTGHTSKIPRSDIDDGIISLLSPLVESGGGMLPIEPWRIKIFRHPEGWLFHLSRGIETSVLCALAKAPAPNLWHEMEQEYFKLLERFPQMIEAGNATPEEPDTAPWLAVLVLPGLFTSSQEDVSWMGDFEQCLAWTILESPRIG